MILVPEPFTRINDKFVLDDSIDADSPDESLAHPLIIPHDISCQTSGFSDTKFYKHFALDIVTETVFDYPYPCITEKTIKPIASKRMFLIVGPYRCLEFIKSLGFLTFDDILDEKYDLVAHPIDRLKTIISSINEFFAIPIEDIKSYMIDQKSKFEYNYEILRQLKHREIMRLQQKISAVNKS